MLVKHGDTPWLQIIPQARLPTSLKCTRAAGIKIGFGAGLPGLEIFVSLLIDVNRCVVYRYRYRWMDK